MSYHIKTEKFEGPLDLLLELIEKEKMNITEFSLAHVTDQYLEYVKNSETIHLENLADFLVVASKLILIKSRALLPLLEFSEEEEEEIKDLAQQLAEFKKFKEASLKLGQIAEQKKIAYSREIFSGVKSVFYPPENFNVYDFKKHFQSILENIPVVEKLEQEYVAEVVTLEQKIDDLQNFLRGKIETSFAELAAGAENKVDVIVSFLAILEMVKQRIVDVEQVGIGEDIRLKISNS